MNIVNRNIANKLFKCIKCNFKIKTKYFIKECPECKHKGNTKTLFKLKKRKDLFPIIK